MSIIRRNIPNLFTAGNLVGGMLAITFTLTGRIDLAPYCILVSAVFDFVDGFIARKLKVDGPLGKQLDSLADMVTFGVAPAIIIFELIRQKAVLDYLAANDTFFGSMFGAFPATGVNFRCELLIAFPFGKDHFCFSEVYQYFPYIGFLFAIFALFRLAKFNLDESQTSSFKGVPTPAATIFIAALPLMVFDGLNSNVSWKQEVAFNILLNPIFLISSTVLLSILMVAPVRLFALKFKSFGWKGNEIRYIFLTISAGLLATLFWWSLPIIIVLYIILSLINNLISKSSTDEIQS